MYEKLSELICSGNLEEALYELQEEYLHIDERTPVEAGKLCVLEASLWEALGDSTAELDALSKALRYDHTNYEIYYMLGLYYVDINVNKAFLCAEMALHYCDNQDDYAVIQSLFSSAQEDKRCTVRNTSIMILSYNDLSIMQKCLESVKKYVPSDSYEIVVVDNASTESGVREYLREEEKNLNDRFVLIENPENAGFPAGCNIGYRNCNPDNDILFLNNDACLTPLSLFWMKMELYDNRKVGACSALSNYASLQNVDFNDMKAFINEKLQKFWPELSDAESEYFETVKNQINSPDCDNLWHRYTGADAAMWAFEKYALYKGVLLGKNYVNKFRLTGFALLLSRDAINAVADDDCIFDERFFPGYFEDDDLGIRIARAGFEQRLCKNSFVYHNGGGGFEGHSDALERGRERFKEKWGFDVWAYCLPWEEACSEVIELAGRTNGILRVIDFTCGFGANAARIKEAVSNVYVAGVCTSPFAAGIADDVCDDVIFGDLNLVRIPWPANSFDVAIYEKDKVCKGQISHCLKPGGIIFADE